MAIGRRISAFWNKDPIVINSDKIDSSSTFARKSIKKGQETIVDELHVPCGGIPPNIPDEVVQEIMLFATDALPSPYSTHYRAPITSSMYIPFPFQLDKYDHLEINLVRTTLKTKIALSRVSKSWRALSADCLFNSIFLHDPWQIPLLSRALDGDKARRGGKEGPGSWAFLIRRLWVAPDWKAKFCIKPNGDYSMLTLGDLLRRCLNIATFFHIGPLINSTMIGTWDERRQIFREILRGASGEEECPHERLLSHPSNFSELDLDLEGLPLRQLIGGSHDSTHIFRSVQVLKFQCYRDPIQVSDELLTAGEFPVLKHLQLNSVRWVSQVTLFRMPSLRQVSLDPGRFGSNSATQRAIIEFLKHHGDCLEELTFLDPLGWELDLDALCPNLVTLNTSANRQMNNTSIRNCIGDVNHAGVTRIGLSDLDFGYNNRRTPDLFFGSLFDAFPNLSTIQAMTWSSSAIAFGAACCWSRGPKPVPHTEFWTKTLELMEKRGIRVLDWRGLTARA